MQHQQSPILILCFSNYLISSVSMSVRCVLLMLLEHYFMFYRYEIQPQCRVITGPEKQCFCISSVHCCALFPQSTENVSIIGRLCLCIMFYHQNCWAHMKSNLTLEVSSRSKDKVVPVVLWRHMGKRRYSSMHSLPGSGWRWMDSFMPHSLHYQRTGCQYTLNGKLGGPHCYCGCFGKVKKSLVTVGNQTMIPWLSSL